MKLTQNVLKEAIIQSLIEEAIEDYLFEADAAEATPEAEPSEEPGDSAREKHKLLKLLKKPDIKAMVRRAKDNLDAGRISKNTYEKYIADLIQRAGDEDETGLGTGGEKKDDLSTPDTPTTTRRRRTKKIKRSDVMTALNQVAAQSDGILTVKGVDKLFKGVYAKLRKSHAQLPAKDQETLRTKDLPIIRKIKREIIKILRGDLAGVVSESNNEHVLVSEVTYNFLKKIIEARISHYAIDVDEPLSVREVAQNWATGDKPYDEADYHAVYPLDDILEYRDFDWVEEAETKSPEEYNKLLQDIKELGRIEPVEIHVGKNGQAAIADGNNRLAVAQQLNIKTIPVKFIFLEDEVRKAGKMTLEPAEISTPAEEQHTDSYYKR